jgi:hypothetical protein
MNGDLVDIPALLEEIVVWRLDVVVCVRESWITGDKLTNTAIYRMYEYHRRDITGMRLTFT